MNKDKSMTRETDAFTTREQPAFEPPAIRVLARFEEITLGTSGAIAEKTGFKVK